MSKQNNIFVFKSFLPLMICFLAFTNVFAANSANENYSIVASVGEVRIGDFVWNKIKFDVVLENQSANKIIYEVEK